MRSNKFLYVIANLKFYFLFTLFCIICIIQSIKIDNNIEEHIDYVFKKRHILNHNNNNNDYNRTIFNNNNKTSEKIKCIRPDIEQFPKGLMNQYQRIHGGIILHFIFAFYMFIGLTIICDDYFVPALESICQVLNLKDDVAGATLMAAGSSAPELATTIIALFIAKDVDIGIGTVVGSAVFNIMFVVGLVAIFSGTVISLNGYPLIRDSVCYLIAILSMVLCIIDEKVYWYEAFSLLILYIAYIIAMLFNNRIETWTKEKFNFLNLNDEEQMNILNNKNYSTLENETMSNSNSFHEPIQDTNSNLEETEPIKRPFDYPKDENLIKKIYFFLCFPLNFIIFYTIPNLKLKFWKRFYPLTFLLSLIWLTVLSYIMVWMITIIGFTFRIPDTIMGLTFIAFGASIPDCFSSLIVARRGHGNMAISNAMGSNIFDILICLGIPWFIGSLSINKTNVIIVKSKGLTYSTITLFATVIILIVSISINKWKLDKKLGIVLMSVYVLFVILASLYESNILGKNHLPMCLDSLW